MVFLKHNKNIQINKEGNLTWIGGREHLGIQTKESECPSTNPDLRFSCIILDRLLNHTGYSSAKWGK